jgi:PhnB protein
MITVNPYLNFNGNTEEAFKFYRNVFGGEFITLQRFKDTPEAEKLSEQDKEKIMHIALPLGKGNILMGTDSLESMNQKLQQGNNFYICISAETEAEADEIHFTHFLREAKLKWIFKKPFGVPILGC